MIGFIKKLFRPVILTRLEELRSTFGPNADGKPYEDDLRPELRDRLKALIDHVESLADDPARMKRLYFLMQVGQHERLADLHAMKNASILLHYLQGLLGKTDPAASSITLAIVGFGVAGDMPDRQ